LLRGVRESVGVRGDLLVDAGIMDGADIVASIAMGATFCLVGRADLYGLMAGGREGVDRARESLSSEVRRTMKLLQIASVDELEPRHVTQLRSLAPDERGAQSRG